MTIRPGTLADAPAMARIYNHYVATSNAIFSNIQLTDSQMRRKLEDLGVGSRFPFLIATTDDDAEVTGYAYAHLFRPDSVYDRTWELTIYLHHSRLGRGIGSAMLRRLVDECRKAGAHTLISCVTGGNKACELMHQHAGFIEAGRLADVGWKFGRYLDDVFYQLVI